MSWGAVAVVAAAVIGAGSAAYSTSQSNRAAKKQREAAQFAEGARQKEQEQIELDRKNLEAKDRRAAARDVTLAQQKRLALDKGGRKSTILTGPGLTGPNIKNKTLLGQ